MRFTKVFCAICLVAPAAWSSATQLDDAFSGTCKPGPVQSIDAGDRPDHTYVIATAKCTLSGKIGGAIARQGAIAEHGEITPTLVKTWGVHTVTLDGGDKIFLRYDNSVVIQGGAVKSGSMKYRVVGGTRSMERIRGAGTCTWIGDGDSFSCIGTSSTDATTPKTRKPL